MIYETKEPLGQEEVNRFTEFIDEQIGVNYEVHPDDIKEGMFIIVIMDLPQEYSDYEKLNDFENTLTNEREANASGKLNNFIKLTKEKFINENWEKEGLSEDDIVAIAKIAHELVESGNPMSSHDEVIEVAMEDALQSLPRPEIMRDEDMARVDAMQKKTLVVELFGAPGVGKSILAGGLYYQMGCDERFKHVEHVKEYAKQLVWEKRLDELSNQGLVTKGQYGWIMGVIDECDIVVTDSPISLGRVYGENSPEPIKAKVERMIEDAEAEYTAINIFLKHDDETLEQYKEAGRLQDASGSLEVESKIETMLKENGKPYMVIEGRTDPETIAEKIWHHINKKSPSQKKENGFAKATVPGVHPR